jgi:hypothetical protein
VEQKAKFPSRVELDLKPWMVGVVAVLACGAILLVGYRHGQEDRARSMVLNVLEAPDSDFVVTVNGRVWPHNNGVLTAIRGVRSRAAHHSAPDHAIYVVIRGKRDDLELTLARDSVVPQEYWVFWTRQDNDLNRLEIGRIETPLFDGE